MKKFLAILLVLTMVFCFAACGSETVDPSTDEGANESGYAGPEYALTLGHVIADGTPGDEGCDYFAKLVSERSGGKITVEVYPNSALGDNRAMIESVQQGTLDMVTPAVANLAAFTDSTKLFDLPWLFSDAHHAEAFLDSEHGQKILDDLEASGLKGLTYMLQGWRELTTNGIEFHKAGDLNGCKLRVQDNEIHIAFWKELGAAPTTLAFAELFTALQQKTIDAQENPISNIKLSGFYEVQDNVIMTDHIYDPLVVVMSMKTWNNLDPAAQEIIQQAWIDARDYERDFAEEFDAEILAEWEDDPEAPTVTYLTAEEKAALREAVQPVYDQYAESIGADLIDLAQHYGDDH